LIAGALGVGYSARRFVERRFAAILLVFAMNFASHFFLALGEGARISSQAAAWTGISFWRRRVSCFITARPTGSRRVGLHRSSSAIVNDQR
jgi:hypothetical protein